MAGDWLKVEVATPDKPETLAITAAMGWDDPDLTVGKLFRVWRWFDQQTVDGNAPGVTPALLDRIAGVTGFAEAMHSVGWLEVGECGLTLPNFDRHNGKTAKNRALTARRVAKTRSGSTGYEGDAGAGEAGHGNADRTDSVTQPVTVGALPRDRVREEKEPPPNPPGGKSVDPAVFKTTPGFDVFWQAWPASPRKVAKAKCFAKWRAAKLEANAEAIAAHVRAMAKTRSWVDGYEPAPMTYLNQQRWIDEVPVDDARPAAAPARNPIEAKYPGWRVDDRRAIELGRAIGAGDPRPGESWHEYRSRIAAQLERADDFAHA